MAAGAAEIWSGDGGRNPIEPLGSLGEYWASSGASSPERRRVNGAESAAEAPRRFANCSASRRRRGSGTAAWASTMSRDPSSGRTGSAVLTRVRSIASGVIASKGDTPVAASKRISASA